MPLTGPTLLNAGDNIDIGPFLLRFDELRLVSRSRSNKVERAARGVSIPEVTAVRKRVTVSLNSKRVADYTSSTGWYGSGAIALNLWGISVVQFQRVVIEILPD